MCAWINTSWSVRQRTGTASLPPRRRRQIFVAPRRWRLRADTNSRSRREGGDETRVPCLIDEPCAAVHPRTDGQGHWRYRRNGEESISPCHCAVTHVTLMDPHVETQRAVPGAIQAFGR